MKDATLSQLRDLASALATRKKKQIGLVTGRGTVSAIYDSLLKTVSVGGMTVPEKGLPFWIKAVYGARLTKIT